MRFLDFFNKNKKKNQKMQEADETINQAVHDKKNEFTNHMFKIRSESNTLHSQIEEAKKTSKRIQKLLTITETTFVSSGGVSGVVPEGGV